MDVVVGRWTGDDAGRFCQAYRERCPWLSNESLARDILQIAPRTVYNWRRRPGTDLRPATQRLLEDALASAPESVKARFVELLGGPGGTTGAGVPSVPVCSRPAGHSGSGPREDRWQPTGAVELAGELTRSDLMMDRRELGRALTATVVGGPPLLHQLEAWLRPTVVGNRERDGRLGRKEVAQLEQIAVAFRRWSHQRGGRLLRKAVVGQLSAVAAALGTYQSPEIELRLYKVMAQLAGTAASTALDNGMQRAAQEYYQLALRSSHAGADRLFGANVLAAMARQMLYLDRPRDALDLVRLGQEGTAKIAGPRLRAMLHTREAWAYAAMGRVMEFRNATAQGAEALAGAGACEEPYWISYFDSSELSGVTGGRLLELARRDPRLHTETAVEHIVGALDSRGPEAGRSHAMDRIGLAECYFLQGDIAEACEHVESAVQLAENLASSRINEQLAGLYSYTLENAGTSCLRDARDRLRAVLAN